MRVEGRTTDPQGRTGVAVTFAIRQGRLIIDPDTSKVADVRSHRRAAEGRAGVVLESGWTDAKPSPPSTG
ncbi:hypothetical protein [Nonomuraea sp. JJY05]|uniref:hypothetical protein n=1 Tax=Nonomuraea sp. JJY05 TaxID=3350255 RepID=UPI00373E95F8